MLEIHHQFLCLADVKLQAFLLPTTSLLYFWFMLSVDAPYNGGVIKELLQVLYWKPYVYKVKTKGDRTVACGAPVLLTTAYDSHSSTFLSQSERQDGIEGTCPDGLNVKAVWASQLSFSNHVTSQ